jgi:hypothetical protein
MTNVNLILRSYFTTYTSSQLVLLVRRGNNDFSQILHGCYVILTCLANCESIRSSQLEG